MTSDIRLATVADLAAVQDIVHAAYSPYVARIGRGPGPMVDDYEHLIIEGLAHVIERGGAVQGIVVLIPMDEAMLLDNVAVAPPAQGRGLGRQLMSFAEQEAVRLGYRSIKLYTNEAMTENI